MGNDGKGEEDCVPQFRKNELQAETLTNNLSLSFFNLCKWNAILWTGFL